MISTRSLFVWPIHNLSSVLWYENNVVCAIPLSVCYTLIIQLIPPMLFVVVCETHIISNIGVFYLYCLATPLLTWFAHLRWGIKILFIHLHIHNHSSGVFNYDKYRKVWKYLNNTQIFYVTAVDGDQPKGRLFSFEMTVNDRIYSGVGTF